MAQGERSAVASASRADTRSAQIRAWAWVGAWTLVVLGFSQATFSADATASPFEALMRFLGVPADLVVPLHFFARKAAHVLEYATLGALAFRALGLARAPAPAAALALALAFAVASTDELLQSAEPSRTGTPRDVALDLAGAALGVAVRRGWLALRRAPLV